MRSDIHSLLKDIQAAARIGHAESLWAALENLQDLPQIAGNHPLDKSFIIQVILPVGEAIGQAGIGHAMLKPLSGHPFSAYRAVAGVALIEQYLHGLNGTNLKALNVLVRDPRREVRDAIRLAVEHSGNPQAEKLNELFHTWQQSDATRVQALAYQILPSLPEELVLDKLQALGKKDFTSQPEVRKVLSRTLSALAANGHAETVLRLLSQWAASKYSDHRMVADCLSRPWAAAYPAASLDLLTSLASHTSPGKRIRKVLQSLYRHGAEAEVRTTLAAWRDSTNTNLQAAASDKKLNL
jgi:hypothetical protein